MPIKILPHRFGKRFQIERDRVPRNLKVYLEVIVDGAVAESDDLFPRDVNRRFDWHRDSF